MQVQKAPWKFFLFLWVRMMLFLWVVLLFGFAVKGMVS